MLEEKCTCKKAALEWRLKKSEKERLRCREAKRRKNPNNKCICEKCGTPCPDKICVPCQWSIDHDVE